MNKPWYAGVTISSYEIAECEGDFDDVRIDGPWWHTGDGQFGKYFKTEQDAKDGVIKKKEKQIVDAIKVIKELRG